MDQHLLNFSPEHEIPDTQLNQMKQKSNQYVTVYYTQPGFYCTSVFLKSHYAAIKP